jgi:hypothetical protein
VGNVNSWTISDWQRDIRLAQDSHIDAFALNIANNGGYASQIANAFSAANSLGFKLFFSFDYAAQGAFVQQDVIGLVNQYRSNSAYYKYNGKPFVSTFEGPGSSGDWTAIKSQTECFFIPDWSSLGAQAAISRGVADGLFSWEAWPSGPTQMTTAPDNSYKSALNGKPYMMPVSPWFFTNLPGYGKNWLWRGDDLWFDRWSQVMNVQPDFVEILTWNDWGESHYIAPLDDRQWDLFDSANGNAPYNYAQDMPHDGWRLFLPYVIDMYKNGKASISTEGLVSWYRRSPGMACASGGTTGNSASQGQQEYPPAQVAQDRVFFSALLTSYADVTVTIGSTTQTGIWKDTPSGGSGIYHGSVPFKGRGAVSVKISRDGKLVMQMNGESITDSCTHNIENWNAWVGSASATGSGSGPGSVSTASSSTLKTSTTAPASHLLVVAARSALQELEMGTWLDSVVSPATMDFVPRTLVPVLREDVKLMPLLHQTLLVSLQPARISPSTVASVNSLAAAAIALQALAHRIRQRQQMAMGPSVLLVAAVKTWPDFAASRATMDSALAMLVPALKEEVK